MGAFINFDLNNVRDVMGCSSINLGSTTIHTQDLSQKDYALEAKKKMLDAMLDPYIEPPYTELPAYTFGWPHVEAPELEKVQRKEQYEAWLNAAKDEALRLANQGIGMRKPPPAKAPAPVHAPPPLKTRRAISLHETP